MKAPQRPWRKLFWAEAALPSSVMGPVESWAFVRFAVSGAPSALTIDMVGRYPNYTDLHPSFPVTVPADGSFSDWVDASHFSPGGTTIAHGLLSLSLAPLFIRCLVWRNGLRNTRNYGAYRIRYLAPVPAGSKLRGRVSVAEVEDVPPDGLRVNYHLVIEIEGGKKPACVAELIALHYR